MTHAQEFCPQCGNARIGAFRFCRSCGFDYDSSPPPNSVPRPAAPIANTGARPGVFSMAGALWLVVAALNLFVLLLLAAALAVDGFDAGGLLGLALGALLVLLAFAVGTRLLRAPTRPNAYRSAALAVVFLFFTIIALASPVAVGEVAILLNVIQGVAVILAGVLPLLAPNPR